MRNSDEARERVDRLKAIITAKGQQVGHTAPDHLRGIPLVEEAQALYAPQLPVPPPVPPPPVPVNNANQSVVHVKSEPVAVTNEPWVKHERGMPPVKREQLPQ